MFERMDIAESIYEVLLKPSYKQFTRADDIYAGHSRKKGSEAVLSHIYSAISETSDKHRKRYVDNPKSESIPYLAPIPGHSSDEYKVLRDFGITYSKIRPTNDRGHDHATINKLNRHQ